MDSPGRVLSALILTGLIFLFPPEKARGLETDALIPEEFDSPQPLKLTPSAERSAQANALFLQALFEEESDGPDKALETKRRVLELDPGFCELAVDAAHQYLRRGENFEAITVLKDAAKAEPLDPSPSLALASIYLRQLQKPEQAEKFALQALNAAPTSAEAYESLWEIYRSTSQKQKLDQLFTRAEKQEMAPPDFWLAMADLRLRRPGNEARPAPAELEMANTFLERAASLGIKDGRIQARAGDYFLLSGNMERARELYERALDAHPNLEGVKEKLAACLLESGDSTRAIEVLEEIVKSNPLDLRAYDQLAQLHLKAGEFQKALVNLRQSLLIAPPDPRRYEDVIRLSLGSEDPKTALELSMEAYKTFPSNLEFLLFQAIALSAEKRHDEAIKAFERTLVEAGNSRPELLDADFYFGYGVAAEQAGRFVKAAELLQKSIDLDPANSAKACNYLGYMWAERNENLPAAEALIRRALEQDANNGAYLDSLGWVLYRQGKYQEALSELLRAATALDEPDPIVLEHVGDAYEKLGKTAEAVLYWQKALQYSPLSESLTSKLDTHAARVAQKPKPATPQTPVH